MGRLADAIVATNPSEDPMSYRSSHHYFKQLGLYVLSHAAELCLEFRYYEGDSPYVCLERIHVQPTLVRPLELSDWQDPPI